jgi:hypothetical protein
MARKLFPIFIGVLLLTAVTCGPKERMALPLPHAADTPDEITAVLPVIPDTKFSLGDYSAIGDGKTLNTDAFNNAVAAIAKAGGGHLIVQAGIYKTLPFTLVSHMDLHLEDGATIKALIPLRSMVFRIPTFRP